MLVFLYWFAGAQALKILNYLLSLMTNTSYRSVIANVFVPLLVVSFAALVPAPVYADGMNGGYTGFIDTAPSTGGGYSGFIDSYPTSGGGGGYSGYIDTYPSSTGGYSGYIDNYGPSSFSNYGPSSYTLTPPTSYYNNNYVTDFSYYPSTYYSSMPYSGGYQTNYSYYPNTYDYSYDSYEYVYEYEYNSDYCPNLPGNQSQGYDCDRDTYDYCSNLPGNQPYGYDCYRDHNRDNVSCDLSVSDSNVEDGDRVTLRWETDGNPNYASINQGIGRVDEDGGSERVRVDGDTTFRMTVRNSSGDEDTCSVTVRVDERNDNTFSSVSFVGEPTNNPPVVYLSDIPYTGLEDISPALLSYWLMLIAAAAGGVWFLYRNGMIPTFAFASPEPIEEGHGHVEEVTEGHGHATPEVESFLAALTYGDTEKALDYVRKAAVNGTGVEEFLTLAERAALDGDLKARVGAALAESRLTGIRGAKSVLA